MTGQKLYSIGQFAKMCDVTIKQLRYLEEKGVLIPKVHNTDNNYRYYSHSQLDQLIFIKTLRDLDVPFRDIVHIFQRPDIDTCVDVLQSHLDSIDEQIKQLLVNYRQCTAYLTHMLKGQNRIAELQMKHRDGGRDLQIVEVPLQTVLYTRYRTNVAAGNLFLERFVELKKESIAHNIPPSESLHAVFHDGYMKQFEDQDGDLETFFPVSPNHKNTRNIRQLGGFQGLSCTYVGHYKHMRECYLEMEAWADQHDVALMNLSIEIYRLGPDLTIKPDQYVTQVIIPLAGSIV